MPLVGEIPEADFSGIPQEQISHSGHPLSRGRRKQQLRALRMNGGDKGLARQKERQAEKANREAPPDRGPETPATSTLEIRGTRIRFPDGFSTEVRDVPVDPIPVERTTISSADIAEVAGFPDYGTTPGEVAVYGVALGVVAPDQIGVRVVRPGSRKDTQFLDR